MGRPRVKTATAAASTGRAVVEATGRRLAAELSAAFAPLPAECRSIRGMAAYLGVDPNICQRAIAASQLGADPLAALQKAPGVAGCRLLIRALIKKGVPRNLADALDAAVDQFAHQVQESGGSHAKLQRRLAALQDSHAHQENDAADESLRRQVFLANAAWLGTRLDTHAAVTIGRPVPNQPDSIEGAKINAFLGHRARESSLPLVTANFYRSGEPRRDLPPGQVAPPRPRNIDEGAVLMPEYSSSPAHLVSARTDQHQSMQIIDPCSADAAPVDIVVFNKLPPVRHPAFCARPLFFSVVRIEQPCKHIVSDVWLERSLAGASVPNACMAWAGEPLRAGEGVPWYHRLPGDVSIELLSPDTLRSSPNWPRQADATRRAFEMLDWRMSSFVGYRISIEYPAWGAAAVIMFDFAPAAP